MRPKANTVTRTFLSRLRRNTGGNVMAMAAIGTIPLIGMVGGALDLSRGYLVRARLQQACDSAVLAGRRSMSGSVWNEASRTAANTFFNANFNSGRYGSTNLSMDYQVGVDNVVHGTAKATVPTTLMRIFDKTEIPITITCDAELQLPNSDIMFVLDTTLSMAETNPGDTTSKIAALRTSVTNFYNALEKVKAPASQVRYGFVPYSSTVNVGMLLKREWMADKWTYQSREPGTKTTGAQTGVQPDTTTGYSGWTKTGGTSSYSTSILPSERCVAPANTQTTSAVYSAYNGTALPKSRTVTQTINGIAYSVSLSGGICTLGATTYNNYTQVQTETVYDNPNKGKPVYGADTYSWVYKPVEYSLTALKGSAGTGLMAGGTLSPSPLLGTNYAARTVTWTAATACIEERQTQRPGTTDVPYDLDVDLVPTADPATQWRPFIPALVYARAVTNYSAPTGWNTATVTTTANYINLSSYPNDRAACPSPSRKLAAITPSQLSTYLNALTPAGLTYHDIGFLWGLRLISPDGLFKSENQTASNGGSIARHIIFMTDGLTETNIADYEAYGLSALDRRRTLAGVLPTALQHNVIVEARLAKLCSIAKDSKNITVWVIAFGTTLTPLLTDCASPNRSYEAKNSAELDKTFAEIAAHIAQLRVTK